MTRTFICIETPEEVKKALALWIGPKKESVPQVRWVSPATLHITLKFCGDMSRASIEELKSALGAMPQYGEFKITPSELFAFPDIKSPRVIVCSVTDGAEELIRLNRCVEEAAAKAGLRSDEMRFKPHLTLGRVWRGERVKRNTMEELRNEGISLPPWTADKVTLMKSTLTRQGPIYTPIDFFKL